MENKNDDSFSSSTEKSDKGTDRIIDNPNSSSQGTHFSNIEPISSEKLLTNRGSDNRNHGELGTYQKTSSTSQGDDRTLNDQCLDPYGLETGDILLFIGNSWYSKVIEYFGESKYSHVGFILKNPDFIPEKGTYLLHSSSEIFPDFEDKKQKFGVRIDKIEDILKYDGNTCKIYFRKNKFERTPDFYKKLEELHSQIHNKPYDLCIEDWLVAKLALDGFDIKTLARCCRRGNNTSTFWCSALVCFLYYKLDLLHNRQIEWSYIAPKEFSKTGNHYLHFKYYLDEETQLEKIN